MENLTARTPTARGLNFRSLDYETASICWDFPKSKCVYLAKSYGSYGTVTKIVTVVPRTQFTTS